MKKYYLNLVFWVLSNLVYAQSPRSINIGDATNDFNAAEMLGTEASRTCYLTWDNTKLYVGILGNPLVGTNSNLYLVFDTNPCTQEDPRACGGRIDQPTNESGGANYPFGAEIVYQFFGTGSNDGSIQNPAAGNKYTLNAGNWVSNAISTGVRIRRHGTDISDLEIPWTDLGISPQQAFNLIIYIANNTTGGSNFAQFPTNNPDGNAPTDANSGRAMSHYFSFERKDGISPSQAQHLSIRTYANSFAFGETQLANLALIGGGQTYTSNNLNTIHKNLFVGNSATFTMGTGTQILEIKGNVTLVGNLQLSTNIGGDLKIGGNLSLQTGANLIHNNREIIFNGNQFQTITGTATYPTLAFVGIENTSGLTGGVFLEKSLSISQRLRLSTGVLRSTATHFPTLSNTATITDASQNSYIEGYLAREVNTTNPYLFPLGQNSWYRPATLTPAGNSPTTFKAAYFAKNPREDGFVSVSAALNHVSYREYWLMDRTAGTEAGFLSLQWGTQSAVGLTGTQRNKLRVARWNGSLWLSEGANAITGDQNLGTIQSGYLGSFSPFTLASTDEENPLPVALLFFEAKNKTQKIQISWQSPDEKQAQKYTLEKSYDAKNFFEIYHTPPLSGIYNFWDMEVSPINYYRLKIWDNKNEFSYSKIIVVHTQEDFWDFNYTNHGIWITWKSTKSINFQCYNNEGKIWLKNTLNPMQSFFLPLQKGFFLLYWQNESEQGYKKIWWQP